MTPDEEADGAALWHAFLAEVAAAQVALDVHAARPALDDAAAPALAGALFALRCSAALVGVEPIAELAAAAEAALGPTPRHWDELRAPLAAAAAALGGAHGDLTRPDASGAHLGDLGPLADATARLAALAPPAAASARPAAAGDATSAPTAGSTAAPAGPDDSADGDDARWQPQVDADMIEPFLDEATERLEALAHKLLRLEAAPRDGDLVREIFRDLHTVKGSSGFVGLRRMNRLAHAAEDLVGQLRDGGRAVDRALIDALLYALDGLRAILRAAAAAARADLAGARIDVSIAPYLARLRDPGAAAAGAAARGPAGASDGGGGESAAAPAHERTLRVDFDKLDTLLNLVGELVLAKARLGGSSAGVAALARELDAELGRARRGRARGGGGRLDLDDLDRFQRILSELGDDLGGGVTGLGHVAAELRQQVMKLRMLPIGRVFGKYQRTVRELCHALGRQARLEISGADTEIDKLLLEQLDDPLLHLVRNAVDHGIETPGARAAAGKPPEGVITLAAQHRGSQIVIRVGDDGGGIAPERLRAKARERRLAGDDELGAMDDRAVLDLIFRPGFSTASQVSEVSGRGVGMDVVRDVISRLQGTIELESTPGAGTTFTLKLPLTLAIAQVLLVRAGGEELALPLDAVARTLAIARDAVRPLYDREVVYVDGEPLPLVWVGAALDLAAAPWDAVTQSGVLGPESEIAAVLVEAAGVRVLLAVERLHGKREVVLKTLGALLDRAPCVAGATLVDDRVVLVLDLPQLVARALSRLGGARAAARPVLDGARAARILLAEDSDVVREALVRALAAHGYEVVAARDGAEALALAERDERGFDLVSTDVIMPRLDGYELTRALRAEPRHREVPIMMITGKGEHLDRVRGFDAGVDEYLVKPLDGAELVRAVERQLRRRPA